MNSLLEADKFWVQLSQAVVSVETKHDKSFTIETAGKRANVYYDNEKDTVVIEIGDSGQEGS